MEILRPAVKELIRVEAVHRIPELVRRAFAVATTGRPGPVVLDVPEDVCHGSHEFAEDDFFIAQNHKGAPALRCRPSTDALREAVEHLKRARRPLILAGGGVHISAAAEALQDFAEAQAIPVAHTMSGKGAIACTHPLSAGLFGRYDRIANRLIETADCLLVVGCKLGEIATKRFALPLVGKPLIHMDILAEEFGRTTEAGVCLWSDAREGIGELAGALAGEAEALRAARSGYAAEVAGGMADWRKSVTERLTSSERPINMARLMHELNRIMPEDGCLVADGGFAAHWAGLLYDTKRPGRGFVPDRGFASIGYGLPGTIGAKLAAGGRPVVGLTGDGGFNMTLGELETVRRLGLEVTLIVVNNAASGYVKALQHLMYGEGNAFSGFGFAMSGMKDGDHALMADFFFQVVFVATAASIISGVVAERMKYWAFIVFTLVLTAVIYPLQGYWTWGGSALGGLLDGFTDFAGSTIVHSVGGWAALAGVLLLGRLDLFVVLAFGALLPLIHRHRGWTHWKVTPWVVSLFLASAHEYLVTRDAWFRSFSPGGVWEAMERYWPFVFACVAGHYTHLLLDSRSLKWLPFIRNPADHH